MKIILSGFALALVVMGGCARYGGPEKYGEGTRMVDGRMEGGHMDMKGHDNMGRMEGDHMDMMGPQREDRGGRSGRDMDSGY